MKEGVTRIGDDAFSYGVVLTSITLSSSVTSIGDRAFYACCVLTSVTIPNSVTSIGQQAYSDCESLVNIVVDEGNPVYDSRDNCNAVIETATNTLVRGCKNTIIPNSVTSIGDYAFEACYGLTSITIPNSVTSIEYRAFFGCNDLTDITIPNSVTSIGNGAFESCNGLADITFGNSVTSIGDDAFKNCYFLTSITLPHSLTSIGDYVFYDCIYLTSIACLNPVPPTLGISPFIRISADATLRVPDVEAYKASDWAQYFYKIEQIDPEAISNIEADKDAPATIYDLSGRRVEVPVEGRIYIVNGKAVVWR